MTPAGSCSQLAPAGRLSSKFAMTARTNFAWSPRDCDIFPVMQPKNAFAMPEDRWLVESPVHRFGTMRHQEFYRVLKTWNLSSGLTVQATAGAMFVFDFARVPEAVGPAMEDMSDTAFDQGIEAKRVRVEIINCFALCLHSAGVELEAPTLGGFRVTHEDLIDTADLHQGASGHALSRLPYSPTDGGYLIPFGRHLVCSADEIGRACDLLDTILQTPHRAVQLTALVNESLDACRGHDFGLAVVTAWTVIEVLLQQLWDEYTKARCSELEWSVNRDRRKFWQGRDFTAAVVTDLLTLAGKVPIDLHPRLNAIRKKRNEWAHDIAPVNFRDATEAIDVGREMLSLVLNIEMQLSPKVSLSM